MLGALLRPRRTTGPPNSRDAFEVPPGTRGARCADQATPPRRPSPGGILPAPTRSRSEHVELPEVSAAGAPERQDGHSPGLADRALEVAHLLEVGPHLVVERNLHA